MWPDAECCHRPTSNVLLRSIEKRHEPYKNENLIATKTRTRTRRTTFVAIGDPVSGSKKSGMISLTFLLSADSNIADLLQMEPQLLAGIGLGRENCRFSTFKPPYLWNGARYGPSCYWPLIRVCTRAFGALILFIQTLALYKSFTYLLTYLLSIGTKINDLGWTWQLSTSIANISGRSPEIQNLKEMW